ncbi:CCA tRNA nucleotidyltransferase [Stakelama tenebrarum]|uniref:CCA tRNA nucleotidyltransferase n=1 Tax=Stakelama tenebrarum TaxID=2711215 RepID=A0A6G6Y4L4_9SPHN|nr:CCA tRNA nucleotidyltransferase [Sphingosinithalassobacter tenebrarum]QIG79894.1 CCA tRNA nucleotidyltransferase [Sphingosinithalassobacter tenebrarum]
MDAVMRLPEAEWRDRAGLSQLADVLGGGAHARFVGGAVRDTLLGLAVQDVDIATRHAPEEVLRRLKAAEIRSVPTGLAHGTITALLESGPVEVTTLRNDVSTDGRRATVAFTDDWREDAARRDFTMNALYADPDSGAIYDYFDGLTDLDARRVRFIGDPYRRIAEDHLRILRFFRFLARFGDEPDAEALAACTDRANDLMALSRERIADELLKLLVARDAVRVVDLMVARGILRPVLPEITVERIARLEHCAALEAAAGITPNAIRRLAALLPDDARLAENVAARLKLSKAQRKRLASAVEADLLGSPYRAAYRLGREQAIDRLLIHLAEPGDAVTAARDLSRWDIPKLPISGGELVTRGLEKGPEVARVLHAIEDRWIDENFPGVERVSEIADAEVAQAFRLRSSA